MPAALTVRVSASRSGRAVWLGVLAFLALLGWAPAGPSTLRERAVQAADAAQALVAGARGSAPDLAGAGERGGVLASRRAAPRSTPAILRSKWHGRTAGADAGGGAALRAARAERLSDVAHVARVHVDPRAQRHLPSGDPSPYDATAPPSATQRDG